MGRTKHEPAPPTHLHARPAVYGLDAGRARAHKLQRGRRRRTRAMTGVLIVVITAAVGGAGWVGYQAYLEHNADDQLEHDRRVAELARERAGQSMEGVIDELEETPRWNGPGNPTFGVGSDTTQP